MGEIEPWRVDEVFLFWTDNADYWEDVTASMDRHIAALKRHQSQLGERVDRWRRIRKRPRPLGKGPALATPKASNGSPSTEAVRGRVGAGRVSRRSLNHSITQRGGVIAFALPPKDIALTKKLVIVGSPAKSRTVGRFLGSGYVVKPSSGHIRDLPSSHGRQRGTGL